MRILAWSLETLILAVGIHLFLRFVRTTRGSRLIRGLFTSVLVSVFCLWGLSKVLDLEELEHILQGAAGFIVVIFAIVFQPEIRRGIAQLGEHSFVSKLIKHSPQDTVSAVVRAAKSMASRRHGALIAFERNSTLNPYVETGTVLDSAVRVRLLESLFYPGSALHDGAVVVRKDRLVAAGCFFPLPQEADLDRSLGTRHRAALGLTEETDAVVLVVSEETGSISLAREGRLLTNLSSDHLEEQLRDLLEKREGEETAEGKKARSKAAGLEGDLLWFAASLLFAAGIIYLAYQEIRMTETFPVRIVGTGPGGRRQPNEGELLVVLPDNDMRLIMDEGRDLQGVSVTGSRALIATIGPSLSGVVEIVSPDWRGGNLRMSDVRWEDQTIGLTFRWPDDLAPNLEVQRYGSRRITLHPRHVQVNAEALDPRYEAREPTIQEDNAITVRGPEPKLELLGTEELPFRLEPIVLTASDRDRRRERVGLAPDLVQQGFRLEHEVVVTVEILPRRREAGTVTREVAMVCLAPDRAQELDRWTLPPHARTARFSIQTSGLIPVDADPASPGFLERLNRIQRFVEENLVVFVDVAELAPDGDARSVPVRWTWRNQWRDNPEALGIEPDAALGGREALEVRLESEREILLEAREDEAPAPPQDRTSGEG